MKKKYLIIMLLFSISAGVFAQASVDIFDPFYDDMTIWENTGIINDAPSIRPYPLQEIKRILQIVIEKGTAEQRLRAADYQKRFFGKVFHFGLKNELAVKAPKKRYELDLSPTMDINYTLNDFLTISGKVTALITNKLYNEALTPQFRYSNYDIADDLVKVSSFYLLPVFNTGVAVGTPRYYFTAGIARTSYGPFHDNSPLVGSHAMHQGQFNFVVNFEKWTYNQAFLTLTATDDTKDNRNPGKFLMLHSLNIRPFPWLSFGMVDSIVYGKRFEPIYMIPFSTYFISQGLYDFPDNSLIGSFFTVKPLKGLRIDGLVYADDLGFNEIVKFKKDAKMRMSGQFGISYTMPKTHWFSFADLNYTFVFPYAYTHYGNHRIDYPNYESYTHNGVPLGSNLEPNSDRIQVKVAFAPLYGLNLQLSNTFIRHANISESITDIGMLRGYLSKEYTTNGTVNNHAALTKQQGGVAVSDKHAFLHSNPFMRQQTIQYVNQVGLDVSCHLPIKKSSGYMLFKFGYTFEADINPGINNNIYKKIWSVDTMKTKTDDEIREAADKQLAEWRSDATGKNFNHYIRMSAEFAY